MNTQEHIVAVVEPTLDGESTLDIAHQVVSRGGRATVVVVVTRKTMRDIQAFAESERLTVPDASEIYFERLAELYRYRLILATCLKVRLQNIGNSLQKLPALHRRVRFSEYVVHCPY